VPELFVNVVGNVRDNAVNEFLFESFDDVGGGGRDCAVARERLREFVHEFSLSKSTWDSVLVYEKRIKQIAGVAYLPLRRMGELIEEKR
jgi:hypothetical protein